ncbi:HIT domain-containing protein [Mycoplasma sp. NEAQ87857]|uniref:histidine triad protein HinT n=1 Tax=Mycoplasma sp. NEAQ87857 TaxID=2683967 RepID=UPI001318A735|nr:HIT family protein [Mycoplasma sp. NEAQ87857]QGZ97388.1 HIT domain-containing protein [Mycoplasma sp. NEAQ87857]
METIFSKIINKDIPAKILYEDDLVIAFYDINPKQPGHFLVVPKNYSKNLIDINDNDFIYLVSKAKELANNLIINNQAKGYKLQVNNEPCAGQEVFHTHIHIIPYK